MHLRSGISLLEMARPYTTSNSSSATTSTQNNKNVQTTHEQSTLTPVLTVNNANVSTAIGVTAHMSVLTIMGISAPTPVSTMAGLTQPRMVASVPPPLSFPMIPRGTNALIGNTTMDTKFASMSQFTLPIPGSNPMVCQH